MKSIVLNCTKLWIYLIEIPPALILALAIAYNDVADNVFKLYPLIIAMIGLIIFISVYFFRLIIIKNDEVRQIGRFSSRDRATINKDKTLIITLLPKKRLKIELFGNDGSAPVFDWLEDKNGEGSDIYLFRGRANGTERTVKKILKFYCVDEEDLSVIVRDSDFKKDYEFVTVTTSTVDSKQEIRIKFNETI